jgi:DNA-binding NarL/FixJ family response regulator
MSSPSIQVLLIDDDAVQSFLIQDYLATPATLGFELRTAATLAEGHRLLAANQGDVLLLDLGLPDSTGNQAFYATQERFPHLPIVVMTGLEDENMGLELVHAGAQDYLVKCQINAPLVCRALRYAIERKRLVEDLQQALAEIKTLSGLLPICAGCKKIRDDTGYWTQIETYIAARSDACFSHGLCPECIPKYFPGIPFDPQSK